MIHTRLDDIVSSLNEIGYNIKSKNQLLVQIGMKSSNASVYANGLKSISDAVINKLVLKFSVNKKFLMNGELPVLVDKTDNNQAEGKINLLKNKIHEIEVENQMLKELLDSMKKTIADKNKIIHLLESHVTVGSSDRFL